MGEREGGWRERERGAGRQTDRQKKRQTDRGRETDGQRRRDKYREIEAAQLDRQGTNVQRRS